MSTIAWVLTIFIHGCFVPHKVELTYDTEANCEKVLQAVKVDGRYKPQKETYFTVSCNPVKQNTTK